MLDNDNSGYVRKIKMSSLIRVFKLHQIPNSLIIFPPNGQEVKMQTCDRWNAFEID